MPLRTLVTGATGLVGSHVVERFLAAGHEVSAFVRPTSDVRFLEDAGVRLVTGDLSDRDAVESACRGVDVVVHAAAQLGEWVPRARFHELNVSAVRRVVEAAAKGGARRVVHVSSVAVYGRAAGRALTEETRSTPTGHPYMDTKAAGEREALLAGGARGVEVAILRPCMIYGPRDRSFLPHVCRNLRRRRMIIIGSGHHPCNTVFAGTVADLALVAATHPKAPGEAFNVADPEPLSWRELLTALALRLQCPPPHLTVPRSVAYAVGGAMEMAARAIGSPKPPPMTRFVAGVLGTDVSYSIEKAERLLGFRPRVSVRDGLDRTLPHLAAA